MNRSIILIGIFIGTMLNVSCQNQEEHHSKPYFINKLEKAENEKDIASIESIFTGDVILYTLDLAPITGKAGVISIYDFVFSKYKYDFIRYITDSAYMEQNKHIEIGININKKAGLPADTNKFKAVFVQLEEGYKISELYFGNEEEIKREIPQMIKPTGKYQVGQRTYYYDRSETENNRTIAFQIWYPTQTKSNTKAIYQSTEVVESSADFLGFPPFMVSYYSLIESNSFTNTHAFPNQQFPVLLYNHGYGGFTSVYQTVFEDLASNGYIVVSIGHEDESALFVKENGSVIGNDPENEFYKSRAHELNCPVIGEYQSQILNSDILKVNHEAYVKLVGLSPLHSESTRLWQLDTKTVYEKLIELNKTDANLKGAFDLESVGIFGHSVGGATAGQLGFDHNFIKAGINLDGFQFGDLINNSLKIPFMFVSSNREENRYLRALIFIDKSEADCFQVAIKGFTHSSFTDLEYFLKGNSYMIELQRQLILTFFNVYLKDSDDQLSELEMVYPEIILKSKIM